MTQSPQNPEIPKRIFPKPQLIGLTGKSGSGKSTVATLLWEQLEPQHATALVSFAGHGKAFGCKYLGFPVESMYGPSEKRLDVFDIDWTSVRGRLEHTVIPADDELHDSLGVFIQWCRLEHLTKTSARSYLIDFLEWVKSQHGSDFWAKQAEFVIHETLQSRMNVVVTDVGLAFVAEWNLIRSLGGKIWRVDKSDCVGIAPRDVETSSLIPDAVICNDGSRVDLEKLVKGLLK